jgi:hypothetical protein
MSVGLPQVVDPRDALSVRQRSKLNKLVRIMAHWKIENKAQATEVLSAFEKFLLPQIDYVDGVTQELAARFYSNFTEVKKNVYFDCRKREWQRCIRMMGMSLDITEKALYFWAADLKRPIPEDHKDHDLIEMIRTIYEDYRGRLILVGRDLKVESDAMMVWLAKKEKKRRKRKAGKVKMKRIA